MFFPLPPTLLSQVESALAEAVRERSPAAIDAALALAASKPSVKIPLIEASRDLLARVTAEFPVLELLRAALKTKRQIDLTRAIDAAEALDLEFLRVKKGLGCFDEWHVMSPAIYS